MHVQSSSSFLDSLGTAKKSENLAVRNYECIPFTAFKRPNNHSHVQHSSEGLPVHLSDVLVLVLWQELAGAHVYNQGIHTMFHDSALFPLLYALLQYIACASLCNTALR